MKSYLENCKTTYTKKRYTKRRSFVQDVMSAGKKKNIVYALFQADITELRKKLTELKNIGIHISLTTYIAYILAQSVNEHKHMHAIKKRSKLILFDDVDIALMVEKEVDGAVQATNYILRSANYKSLYQIQEEFTHVKNTPVNKDGAMNEIEYFFWGLPRFLRKIFWKIAEKRPSIKKQFVGTVGLTSVGMFTKGESYVIPITPMTLTLAVGTLETQLKLINGKWEPRDMLHLTLAIDHDILDGGPLMRFEALIKEKLRNVEELKNLIKSTKSKQSNYSKSNEEELQILNLKRPKEESSITVTVK